MWRIRQILVLLCLMLGTPLAAETIRLTNGEWAPYLGQNLPHHGVASRIIEEAFALEDIEVAWDFYPWSRSLFMAERGQRDGSAVWLRSAEREALFHISDPVVESSYVLFHRQDYTFNWDDVADLSQHRLGVVQDYFYGDAFQQAEREGRLKPKRLGNEEQGLRMLLAKRIDLFPMDPMVAMAMLRERFSDAEHRRLSFHPRPLHSEPLHLLLSRAIPANSERMRRFNRGLRALRESGKVARYLQEIEQPQH